MRRAAVTTPFGPILIFLGSILLTSCMVVPGPREPGPYGAAPSHPAPGPHGEPWYTPPPPPQPPPPAPIRLTLFPNVLDFGSVPDRASSSLEARLRNEGDEGVRIGRATIEGRFFTLAGDDCTGAWLAPGRACTLGVTFSPDLPGGFEGAIQVFVEVPYYQRLSIPLRGQVGHARFPDIRVEPARLDFGDLETSEQRTIRVEVRNTGKEDLMVRDVSVDGRGFARREDSCSRKSLPPGHSCGIVVGFAPPSRGTFEGVLGIASDDPDERLVKVSLSGTGRATRVPDIQVPGKLDFGQVQPGTGQVREVEVRNTGNGDLAVRSVSVDGAGFALAGDGCSGQRVPPGGLCLVQIGFRPAGQGSFSGLLGIVSNDPDKSLIRVNLLGSARGQAPAESQCPVEELRPKRVRDADEPFLLTGSLGREGCITYVLKVQRKGALTVCTPPGYSLKGEGFNLIQDEACRLPKDKTIYRTWRRIIKTEGTEIKDLTITRGNRGAQDFKFLFTFTPIREQGDR